MVRSRPILALKALQEVCSRLGREFVVAEANSDRTSCKVKAIHFFKGLTSLVGIPKSIFQALSNQQGNGDKSDNLLHEAVTTTSSTLLLLKLGKLQLAKRFKDILQILFSDAEMDVTNIKTVEWDRVVVAGRRLGVPCLSVLFCFSKLGDNGNTEEFLSRHLDSKLNRLFILELDVTDTKSCVRKEEEMDGGSPLTPSIGR